MRCNHVTGWTDGDGFLQLIEDDISPSLHAGGACSTIFCYGLVANCLSKAQFDMISSEMRYVPPFALLNKLLDGCVVSDGGRLMLEYDAVLDVLKAFLRAVPVDGNWYQAEYPAIRDFLARMPLETPASHFQKHGYFEGRRPFSPGWRDLTEPVPFPRLKTSLRIIPARGRLSVEIARDDFFAIIKAVLIAVPVDETWYLATYRDVSKAIADGMFPSATHYYAERGYFAGHLPFDMAVDAEWYVSRYDHVRIGLERGVAKSPQDHFMRLGYNEGCRPTPP